jgi:hypothetical protein
MPSSSKKQHKFMEAVAHNPAFAKKAGVPQSVGQDFSNADKGKKFNRGGAMPMDPKMLAMMAEKLKGRSMGARPGARPPMGARPSMAAPMPGMKKGGMFKGKETMKEELAEAKAIKSGKITPMQYAKGEKSEPAMKRGGSTKKMANGGSASSRADGIAQRGKTKGKLLKKGGMAC